MIKELKSIASYHGKFCNAVARVKPVRKDNVIVRFTEGYTAIKKLVSKASFNIELMKWQESANNLIENEIRDLDLAPSISGNFPEQFDQVFTALKNDTIRTIIDRKLLIKLLTALDSDQVELRIADNNSAIAIVGKNEKALIMPVRKRD